MGPPPGGTSCAAVRRSNERSRIAGDVAARTSPMRDNPRVTNPDRLQRTRRLVPRAGGGRRSHARRRPVAIFEKARAFRYVDLLADRVPPRARAALSPAARVRSARARAAGVGRRRRGSISATGSRYTALPAPGGEGEQLKRLAGRLLSQQLNRDKPLWELWSWTASGTSASRWISKTHHCLVDGISGVDIAAVLSTSKGSPPSRAAAEPWMPRPAPRRGGAARRTDGAPAAR